MIGVICLGLILLLLVVGLGLFFYLRKRFKSPTVTEPGMTDFKVNCSVPEFPMEEINIEQ